MYNVFYENLKDLAAVNAVASNQARNFFQQASRAILADSAKLSKERKKYNFKAHLRILVSNLGGDLTNLTCAGKSVTNNDTIKGERFMYLNALFY